jgi:hypothetical protein
MRVSAPGGLRIRSGPGITRDAIGLIPDRTVVEVIARDEATVAIGGVSGRWTKVTWEATTGWVFGGFLIPAEPTEDELGQPTEGDLAFFPDDFPASWTRLYDYQGRDVIFKWCFAGIPTLTLEPGGLQIYYFLGQDTDIFAVSGVRSTSDGFVATLRGPDRKEREAVFTWKQRGRTGTWDFTGWDPVLFVADGYASDYPFVEEKDGDCGEP